MFNTFTVAELSTYIHDMFDLDDTLQDLWVNGEISNMTRAASGHWYFTLKDANSQIRCAMWRSSTERQSFSPQNGDAVTVHGRVSVYEPRGEYQLYADLIRPLGVGDLYARFEQLKAQLEAEGLFAPERKRELPPFPRRIGVVTSPEAAAYQDIQNVLRRRFPLAQVILSPTPVQGDPAPPRIVAALERLNRYDAADVILLCRGGGSIEDLWAFNDERVARAVAASSIPVITGVGHETDFTIVDFVADDRAPTPSAAAEHATPDIAELHAALRAARDVLDTQLSDRIRYLRDDIDAARRTLGHISPQRQIITLRQRIDDRQARLEREQQQTLARLSERLAGRIAALHAADPRALLARGYAIVTRSDNGARVDSAGAAQPGDGITIHLHDGELAARIEDKDSHERYTRTLF